MKKLGGGLAVAAALLALGCAPAAQATDFCVPNLAACPSGVGVAKADLEEAMGTDDEDGQADTVYVGAGTFTENAAYEPEPGNSSPITFEVDGNDPLTVIGSGAGMTTMTSAGSANSFVVNLSYNNGRAVIMRNLRIEVPASFPDGLGAGILLYKGDLLENVVVASLNDESDGVRSFGDGNRIVGGALRGGGREGSIQDGINVDSGETRAEGTVIEGASWGLVTGSAGSRLVARRVRQIGTRTYGALASPGTLQIENSIFSLEDGVGLYVSGTADDGVLEADHLTVVNDGSTYPALEGKKFSSSAGDATLSVSNSIFRGFAKGYKTETPFGPGIGLVHIAGRYSNLPSNGTDTGGTHDFATGNIDADPLFNADLSLPPSSPSVDAGDPASAGLAADFVGAPRPNDGNGDGLAVRDQGAFEYQRPVPPSSGGTGGGAGGGGKTVDTTPPQTTIFKGPGSDLDSGKAKFRFRASEAGSTFVCKLDKRKVKLCKSPKKYSGLKPGRHRFKVWAIDRAGNKDPIPAKRRFSIPDEFSAR